MTCEEILAAAPSYDDRNFHILLEQERPLQEAHGLGALPRLFACGSHQAMQMGLVPVLDYPEKLIPEDEWKDRITEMHASHAFPMYHLYDSGAKPESQNGYGYCWAYGVTRCLEAKRVMQGLPYERLGPNSLGWLVNWRNQGNYLSSAIKGISERGVASQAFAQDASINPKSFREGWEQDALKHRLTEWWDTKYDSQKSMVQQTMSLLLTGEPVYIAYNWWGHALMMAGVNWKEGVLYNLEWVPDNSHGDGLIKLTGNRGVPDEAYGIRAGTWEGN